jgi:uncharacterized protein YcbK (DUF882 family)
LQARRLLLLGAIALGVTGLPDAASVVGTPGAEARPAASTRPAKAKTKTTRSSRSKSSRSARATRSRERERASRAGGRRRSKKVSRVKLCSETRVGTGRRARTRRSCKMVRTMSGHGVAAAELRHEPLERPSGDVWVYSENLREEAHVNIFRPDGAYDEAALAKLDEIFRCRRTQEVRAMDPRLYEQLSRLQDHFGKVRATVVSGFRFAERSSSRHFHASAMDIKLDGVGLRDMYGYAQSLDGGGMGIGIYPHSGFIHVDYRAPGEPSYRWTDYSGPGSSARARNKRHKAPGRTARARRPTS